MQRRYSKIYAGWYFRLFRYSIDIAGPLLMKVSRL